MSEGPNENCEFYKNYENYENCENSEDLIGTQRELGKLHKIANVPRTAYRYQRDPTRTANFTQITRIRELREFARSQSEPTRIMKNANIRKGTKNGSRDARGTQ